MLVSIAIVCGCGIVGIVLFFAIALFKSWKGHVDARIARESRSSEGSGDGRRIGESDEEHDERMRFNGYCKENYGDDDPDSEARLKFLGLID